MNTSMPEAVKIFMEAANSGNTAPLGPFLALDAIIRDEPETREICGAEAIMQFLRESKQLYNLETRVQSVSYTANNICIAAMVSGNFAGSPLAFSYCFTMHGETISHLTIDLA